MSYFNSGFPAGSHWKVATTLLASSILTNSLFVHQGKGTTLLVVWLQEIPCPFGRFLKMSEIASQAPWQRIWKRRVPNHVQNAPRWQWPETKSRHRALSKSVTGENLQTTDRPHENKRFKRVCVGKTKSSSFWYNEENHVSTKPFKLTLKVGPLKRTPLNDLRNWSYFSEF